MAKRTIETKTLEPKKLILIKGNVVFSRINSQKTGEELMKENQMIIQRGGTPNSKPYTTLTINNAQVLYKDPNNKTREEMWAEESMYVSKSTTMPDNTFRFTGKNSGNFLPNVCIKDPNTGQYASIEPKGELAPGLEVIMVLNTFEGYQRNTGVSLQSVLVPGEIKYYETKSNLAEYGFNIEGQTPFRRAPKTVDQNQGFSNPNMQNQMYYQNPQAMMYQNQPMGYPQYTQPQMQPVMQQPMMQPQMQPMAQPMQQNMQTYTDTNGITFDIDEITDNPFI